MKTSTRKHKRINVTLRQETVRLVDRITDRGERSRFIDEAVRQYVRGKSLGNLRKKLREGAHAMRDRDLNLAEDWFILEEEANR